MADETANLPTDQIETPPATEQTVAENVAETPEFTEEQIQSFFQKKGINFDGNFETLKQKLEYTPPAPEPSEEEKTAKERAEEKKLLDVFIKNGGTIEQFSALKGLTQEQDIELGRKAALKELMEEGGFTKEQAEAELKVRYALTELSELSEDDFDTTEEFEQAKAALQKRIDFGAKKLSKKSQFIKKQAEEVFNGLKQVIADEDLRVQKEAEYASKVDEFASKLPRKMTLELGESDGRKLDPIPYDISESTITEIAETLKDKSKRDNIFYDQEGGINIPAVAELMLRNKILESAVKASYLTGATRETQKFESIFPARTAYQVGVGGVPQKQSSQPGKIVRVGTPRVANPQN